MERPISKTSLFVSGAARLKDLIYLIAEDRGLKARDVEHSRFIAFYQLKFAHMGDRNWRAVALCVAKRPTEKMVAIGEDGEVFTYVGGTVTNEAIKPRPACLRGIGVVDGFPFACGMKRQVFRRADEGSWLAMHARPPRPRERAGFEAIAGFSEDEIYAVGWSGEIWQWNGKKWLNRASPTNLILTGVCCAGDGKVYACGQHGTLIRGRNEVWEIIELENFIDDSWDVCWFQDRLYLATMPMLYTFMEGSIAPVEFGSDRPKTCYRLTQAEGVLWSVGSDDVFSYDGATWTRVD